jgi:hypothetical protein
MAGLINPDLVKMAQDFDNAQRIGQEMNGGNSFFKTIKSKMAGAFSAMDTAVGEMSRDRLTSYYSHMQQIHPATWKDLKLAPRNIQQVYNTRGEWYNQAPPKGYARHPVSGDIYEIEESQYESGIAGVAGLMPGPLGIPGKAMQVAGMIKRLANPTKFDPSTVRMFGGEKAVKMKGSDLVDAQYFHDQGMNPAEIWSKTGWFKEPETGFWKFEIDDSQAVMQNTAMNEQGPLFDFLKHNKLYEQYPHLRSETVRFIHNPNDTALGWVDDSGMFLNTAKLTRDSLLPTVLHEVQHLVQKHEGFIQGTSPQAFTVTPEKMALWQSDLDARVDAQKMRSLIEEHRSQFDAFPDLKAAIGEKEINSFDPQSMATAFRDKYARAPHPGAMYIALSPTSNKELASNVWSRTLKQQAASDPYNTYRGNLGETEARLVERRKDLSTRARKDVFPLDDRDLEDFRNHFMRKSITPEPHLKRNIDEFPPKTKGQKPDRIQESSPLVERRKKPRTAYHGTIMDFDEFDPDTPIWLADEDVAYRAAGTPSNRAPEGATSSGKNRVLEVEMTPQKVKTVHGWDGSTEHLNAMISGAKKEGADMIEILQPKDTFNYNTRGSESPYYISLKPRDNLKIKTTD